MKQEDLEAVVRECIREEDKFQTVRKVVALCVLKTIDEDDNPQMVELMDSILCRIIFGEKDEVIAGKSFAELAMMGLFMPKDDLEAMCRKTRERCQKQILGLQIAIDSLQEYDCSAEDALSQIAMLL